MSHVKLIVAGTLVLASLAGGGCSGCNEEYYCDDTGCYWCDSYGCRAVDPPPVASCSHGDWECPSDRPYCTEAGYCVAQCSADADCPAGLRCTGGVCLEPGVPTVPPMHPGFCGGADVCVGGERCAPSGCCLPAGGDACCADVDCGAGLVCDTAEHVCATPPADAGTDDGGISDGGSDGPTPPPPQCRTNAECPAHYLCIDAVCKLPCATSAECGLGCECVAGFCTSPAS
jgi:hypothetical protein